MRLGRGGRPANAPSCASPPRLLIVGAARRLTRGAEFGSPEPVLPLEYNAQPDTGAGSGARHDLAIPARP